MLKIKPIIKSITPKIIHDFYNNLKNKKRRDINKHSAELNYWKNNFLKDDRVFRNDWYEKIMLAMAQEKDSCFLEGKVVADFGCGPRGSLMWLKSASMKIGIDVLADMYIDEFKDCMLTHGMVYLKSTEKAIPLPENTVDVMYTLNAIDHVDEFEMICDEIIRVIKPGGEFIGSFNLEEPATVYEPQCLTEEMIQNALLSKLENVSYRVTKVEGKNNPYEPFFKKKLEYNNGEKGVLWLRAKKVN